MPAIRSIGVLLFVAIMACHAADPLPLMPRVADYTQMWWAEGFPSHTPSAPWLRVIQTGSFAMVMNTETLQVPHFGAVTGINGYGTAAPEGNRDWQTLPEAKLELSMTVEGKTYRCTAGGKWSRWGGPRVIESGRFFQRADVTDLVFTADDGQRLEVEARFETAAWPDRLSLILAARPKLEAKWRGAAMEIGLTTAKGALRQRWELPGDQTWSSHDWHHVALALDPVNFKPVENEQRGHRAGHRTRHGDRRARWTTTPRSAGIASTSTASNRSRHRAARIQATTPSSA